MIRIKTNLKQVTAIIRGRLDKLNDPELLLPVATAMIPVIAQRIHVDGKATDGNPIGEYSSPYLKKRIREGKGSGPAVIASFTRQLQNDYATIATRRGYGIGFNNELNFNKTTWVQETYGKDIWPLTKDEGETAIGLIKEVAAKAAL